MRYFPQRCRIQAVKPLALPVGCLTETWLPLVSSKFFCFPAISGQIRPLWTFWQFGRALRETAMAGLHDFLFCGHLRPFRGVPGDEMVLTGAVVKEKSMVFAGFGQRCTKGPAVAGFAIGVSSTNVRGAPPEEARGKCHQNDGATTAGAVRMQGALADGTLRQARDRVWVPAFAGRTGRGCARSNGVGQVCLPYRAC